MLESSVRGVFVTTKTMARNGDSIASSCIISTILATHIDLKSESMSHLTSQQEVLQLWPRYYNRDAVALKVNHAFAFASRLALLTALALFVACRSPNDESCIACCQRHQLLLAFVA